MYAGTPQDHQNCVGSLVDVGGNLGAINGVTQTVKDINDIAVGSNPTIVNPYTVAVNTTVVGWEYLDTTGHYWVQSNPLSAWTLNVGLSAWFVSFGINKPTDIAIRFVGTSPTKLPPDTIFQQCWVKGKNFGV